MHKKKSPQCIVAEREGQEEEERRKGGRVISVLEQPPVMQTYWLGSRLFLSVCQGRSMFSPCFQMLTPVIHINIQSMLGSYNPSVLAKGPKPLALPGKVDLLCEGKTVWGMHPLAA